MAEKFSKEEVEAAEKNHSAVIVAKIVSVLLFFLVCVFLISEVVVFVSYVLPVLMLAVAKVNGITSDQTYLVQFLMAGVPGIFLAVFTALIHFAVIKKIILSMWHWVVRVFKRQAKPVATK